MNFLEQIAEAILEAALPGFNRARKRVRNPPPPKGTPPPPINPMPPPFWEFDTDAAVLRFIWENGAAVGIKERFGGSFPKFQQAYAQGWIRWQYDGHTLHLWVGPPGHPGFKDSPPPRPMESNAVPAALKALDLKPEPMPTPEEIRAAFRQLAQKYHPDVNPRGAARMKKLTAAYAVLKGAKLA